MSRFPAATATAAYAPSVHGVQDGSPDASLNIEALLAVQETMRQFLAMQERVLQQFLHAADHSAVTSNSSTSIPVRSEIRSARPSSTSHPLIRGAPQRNADGSFMLSHRLSLASDPYLADHVIGGTPVLPMAMALEYTAQFVSACWPGWHVIAVRDLQLMAGLMLDEQGCCDIELQAQTPAPLAADLQSVAVTLQHRGRKAGPNYRATVLLSTTPVRAPTAQLPAPAGSPMSASETYSRLLFHGSRFRCIKHVFALGDSGQSSSLQPTAPSDFLDTATSAQTNWLFDPALIDAAPQMAWAWSYLKHGVAALPSRMAVVRRYDAPPVDGPLQLVQSMTVAPNGDTLRYTAEYVDVEGRVRYSISSGESTMSAGLNRLVPASADFVHVQPPSSGR